MNLIKGTLHWSVISFTIIVALGIFYAGWQGALSGAVGVALTDADLVSLGFFTKVLVHEQPGVRVTRLCLAFLVLKLPVLFGAVFLVTKLGMAAVACFLGGIALVYSALVLVAIRGAGRTQPDPFS